MRWPVPSAREVRWSFYVAAVGVLLIVVTLCWGIVHKVQQSDDFVKVAISSTRQVDRLSDQIDAQVAAAESQRKQLRATNRQLRATNRQQHAELVALLHYLRSHGIKVPPSADSPGPATHPKGPGPRGPSPSPGPTPTPGPSRPPSPKPSSSTPRPSPSPSPRPPSPTGTTTPPGTPDPVTDLLCLLAPLLFPC